MSKQAVLEVLLALDEAVQGLTKPVYPLTEAVHPVAQPLDPLILSLLPQRHLIKLLAHILVLPLMIGMLIVYMLVEAGIVMIILLLLLLEL